MYCYIYLTSQECGLREVYLWAKLSSEHPVFLISVANCLNINLAPNVVAGLHQQIIQMPYPQRECTRYQRESKA